MLTNLSVSDQKRLGHSLNDTLISCSFNEQPCDHTNFTWLFEKEYGNCYAFNANQNGSEVYLTGVDNGLRIELYVNFYEKLSLFNALWGVGAQIRIENSSYKINSEDDGIYLAPGYYTKVNVERHFKFTMPRPFSNCDLDNELTISYGKTSKVIF